MTAKPELYDPTAPADEGWLSQCCLAPADGPISAGWFDITHGGRFRWLRSGLCGKCGQRANFDRAKDRS